MAGGTRNSSGAAAVPNQRSINTFFAPKKSLRPSHGPQIGKSPPKELGKAAEKFVSTELPILTSIRKLNAGSNVQAPTFPHEAEKGNGPGLVKQRTPPAVLHKVDRLRTSPRTIKFEKAKDGKEDLGLKVVKRQVEIFWPADQEWYSGSIQKYDGQSGKHTVLYDDSTVEELILADEKVRWLDIGDQKFAERLKLGTTSEQQLEESPKVGGRGRKRGRRKVTYISEDEDFSEDDIAAKDDDFVVDEEMADVDSDDDVADMEDGSDDEGSGARKKPPQKGALKRRKTAKTARESPRESPKKQPQCPAPGVESDHHGAVPPKPGVDALRFIRTAEGNALRASTQAEKPEQQEQRPAPGHGLPDLSGEASARFGNRVADCFDFLLPQNRRDAGGRKPGHEAYDPKTVALSKEFLKKLSPGQRQWWEFKAQNMDKVLLFKMGKFYEMFEMDAHIGVQELNLIYMKGDQPHCGFPEKGFSHNAEALARKGYRVLVIEQVETPAQMAQRNKAKGTKDAVVRREVVSVLTKGTLVEADMLASHPEASYLLAVSELAPTSTQAADLVNGSAVIGVCAVDTATSSFMVGQFVDDAHRGRLRSILAELRPVELIKPITGLDSATERALKDHTRQPLINSLEPGKEFWTADRTKAELSAFFGPLDPAEGASSWPPYLQSLARAEGKGEAAITALGGTIFYLRQALLESDVLALGRIEPLPGSVEACVEAPVKDGEEERDVYMVLDSAALENLEILENNKDGGVSGTLLATVDHCVTAIGRRMLRAWLCRPLQSVKAIIARQEAVLDLKQGPGFDAMARAKKRIAGLPDLERLLARLHAVGSGSGRHADKVVLYEDEAKKKLSEFISILRGCKAVVEAIEGFQGCKAKLTSPLLRRLVTFGELFPQEVVPALQHFKEAFDWAQAEKEGRIVPTGAVDDKFDAAAEHISEIESRLNEYLEEQKKQLKCRSITYVNVNKDRYLLEMPDTIKVPLDFERGSGKKGVQRYHTPAIKELLAELAEAEREKEDALKEIFRKLLQHFCRDHAAWTAAIKAIAQLDALSSLAGASLTSDSPMCRPTFTPPAQAPLGFPARSAAAGGTPKASEWLYAKGLRHPSLHSGATIASGGSFVPNDTCLGEAADAPPFMLLTGPNMGGKSTLLRQVCLAVVLAQVGADVPAEAFSLSPVDRVFVRMGARDHIMSGQSTFFVELSETAAMLRSATRSSLVALDELGRGTATTDGAAIAYAVLHHLAHSVGCRGMFSTHYHRLADEHADDPTVQLRHMACKVGESPTAGVEEVTFLYQLAEGACPKSYGTNVAKLAGMPNAVLTRAAAKSAEVERSSDELTAGSSKKSTNAGDGREPPLDALEKELFDRLAASLKGSARPGASGELVEVWQEAKRASVESPQLSKRRRLEGEEPISRTAGVA